MEVLESIPGSYCRSGGVVGNGQCLYAEYLQPKREENISSGASSLEFDFDFVLKL